MAVSSRRRQSRASSADLSLLMDRFHLPVLGSVSPAGKLGHVPGAFLRPHLLEVFFTFLCSLRTSGGVPLFSVVTPIRSCSDLAALPYFPVFCLSFLFLTETPPSSLMPSPAPADFPGQTQETPAGWA